MAPVKGNLWRQKPAALEYAIEDKNGEARISWRGESKETAVSLLAQPESAEESNALADAKNFLIEFLQNGKRAYKDVRSASGQAGIARRTMERAKAALRIKTLKFGFGIKQHFEWELPDSAKVPNELADSANIGSLADSEQVPETKPVNSTSSADSAKPRNLAESGGKSGQLADSGAFDAFEDEGEVRL
jgi:hypothetical protein